MTEQPGFGARAVAAMDRHGPLCLGLDPSAELLGAWGLPDDATGLRRFCEVALGTVGGTVAAVKPQSAFFERHGAAGVQVLQEVLQELSALGTLSVLDAKRGDIGSTMDAYAQAYLSETAPMAADAVTVSPYLGYGSLAPAVDLARETGRGVFVLALTSNPEGREVQHVGDPPVAVSIVDRATAENDGAKPAGHVGLVVGATVGSAPADLGIDLAAVNGILLTPGVGAQGGTPADLARTFEAASRRVLAPVSRELLRHGPDPDALRRAAESATAELAAALRP